MIRSEEEVDKMIEEMMKTKGNYITQGITFSKKNERQIEMLKYVLMRSQSFSGFMKELLANEIYSEGEVKKSPKKEEPKSNIDTGNFMA